MADNKALLKAVHDDPADDAVRLAYADWLDENGDRERAEFIRIQIELARLVTPRRDPERWGALRDREWELLGKRESRWRKKLPQFDGVGLEFARGFAEVVVPTSLAALREHADALFKKLPVQELHFPLNSPEDVAGLADFEPLARCTRLRLCYLWLDDEEVKALARSPHLSNLRLLDLASTDIGPESAKALAAAPGLARLEVLDLNFNDVGTHGARAILLSPHLKRLKCLMLRQNGVSPRTKTAAALRKRFRTGLYL